MVLEVVGVDRNLQEVILLSQKRLSIHSEESSITKQPREEQTLKEYTNIQHVETFSSGKTIFLNEQLLFRCWVMSHSFATPWTIARQAPLSMGFLRQESWSGLLFPFPGDLPNPLMEPVSPALAGRFATTEAPGKPHNEQPHRKCSIIWMTVLQMYIHRNVLPVPENQSSFVKLYNFLKL